MDSAIPSSGNTWINEVTRTAGDLTGPVLSYMWSLGQSMSQVGAGCLQELNLDPVLKLSLVTARLYNLGQLPSPVGTFLCLLTEWDKNTLFSRLPWA